MKLYFISFGDCMVRELHIEFAIALNSTSVIF